MTERARVFTLDDVKLMAGYRPTPYEDAEWEEFIAMLDARGDLSTLYVAPMQLELLTLSERERLVLAWERGPEEWEDEYGGQYGAELVDAQRKQERLKG